MQRWMVGMVLTTGCLDAVQAPVEPVAVHCSVETSGDLRWAVTVQRPADVRWRAVYVELLGGADVPTLQLFPSATADRWQGSWRHADARGCGGLRLRLVAEHLDGGMELLHVEEGPGGS